MQEPYLKLSEIIWEITGHCKNNCAYCGSKEIRDKKIDYKRIQMTLERILDFPPKEITISGGDPTSLSAITHKNIVKNLKEKNVICKILFNPLSYQHQNMVNEKLELYDVVGVSINTQDELNLFQLDYDKINPTTIVTNFNIHNYFLYEEIEKEVKKDMAWQIQFTMYDDKDNANAIFNNDFALAQLSEKIRQSLKNGVKIVIADNANTNRCGAGIYSIGITYDGFVLPCLSMRSWDKGISKYFSSLMETDIEQYGLKTIWEQGFYEQRFGCFECCKDFCKNKVIDLKKELDPYDFFKDIKKFENTDYRRVEIPNDYPPGDVVLVYGVSNPRGVSNENIPYPNPMQVEVYGVVDPTNFFTDNTITISKKFEEFEDLGCVKDIKVEEDEDYSVPTKK